MDIKFHDFCDNCPHPIACKLSITCNALKDSTVHNTISCEHYEICERIKEQVIADIKEKLED